MTDLRYVLRHLARHRGFTAVAVATLAVGIGANTAIFSVVNAVLLRPLPYPEAERLVRVWDRNEAFGLPFFSVSVPHYLEWSVRSRAFEALGAYREGSANLVVDGEPLQVGSAQATASLFRVLGSGTHLGRTFTEAEDRPGGAAVAVLGHGLWQRRFGGQPDVVGRRLTLNGEPTTIVGILAPDFEFPQNPDVELIIPYRLEVDPSNRGSHFLRVLGRLRPGVDVETARADMARVARELERDDPETSGGWTVALLPLHEATVGSARDGLLLLSAAVVFVLLIACVNVANLLLARATVRTREIAVRAALGASRYRIGRLVVVEGLVLSLIAAGIGTLLAVWGTALLASSSASGLPRAASITVDARVLAFTLGLAAATGIAFAVGPALFAACGNAAVAIREAAAAVVGSGRGGTRRALVAFEVAAAFVLVVAAGLVLASFVRLVRVDPGFSATDVLVTELTPVSARYPQGADRSRFYAAVIERIAEQPGVTAVGAVHRLPLAGNSGLGLHVEGRAALAEQAAPSVNYRAVSSRYFAALGVPLLSGRLFTDQETWETGGVVLINRALAERYWPDGDPLGQRVGPTANGPWSEIVGVVADVRESSLTAPAAPALYVPYVTFSIPTMTLVIRTAMPPQTVAPSVRAALTEVDPEQAMSSLTTMDGFLATVVAAPRFRAVLLGLFAAVALVLSAAGIFAVVAYTVSRRRREIGLRRALGARSADVIRAVARGAAGSVGLGLAAGLLGAVFAGRLLRGMLFGIAPLNPLVLAGAITVLCIVAALACAVPVRQAMALDPLEAIRHE